MRAAWRARGRCHIRASHCETQSMRSQPSWGKHRTTMRSALVRVFGLVLLGAAACSKSEAPAGPKSRPPPLVVVAKAEARDVPVEIHAPVDLRPLEQVDVGSKVLGYV